MGWPEERASDADRDKTANLVRAALEQGRLNFDEYDERLRAVYAAKTYADLEEITADLPRTTLAEEAKIADREIADLDRQVSGRRRGNQLPGGPKIWVIVALLCLGIWIAASIVTGRFSYFLPIWVIAPLGIVLFSRYFSRRR